MKPTAVLLTVILLVTASLLIGGSFTTENKKEVTATDCYSFPEMPLKKENAALPPPPPDSNPELLPMIVHSDPVAPGIDVIEIPIHTVGCDLLPPPIMKTDEDGKEKENDDIHVLGCNLETEPEYPGGAAAWQRYLNRNMRFPMDSPDNEIQSSVVVQFVVDEEGDVCEVEAVSGSRALGAEAVRVIKKSGKWTPAIRNGRAVKSFKRQPFVIHPEVEE